MQWPKYEFQWRWNVHEKTGYKKVKMLLCESRNHALTIGTGCSKGSFNALFGIILILGISRGTKYKILRFFMTPMITSQHSFSASMSHAISEHA
jgi:hypothetical protein